MSDKKKEAKVVEPKKRYISDAIKSVFTTKHKGKEVNIVDAFYSIAEAIRSLSDELKKMNETTFLAPEQTEQETETMEELKEEI